MKETIYNERGVKMGIEDRLRRIAKKDRTEWILDDSIESVKQSIPPKNYNRHTYAAALTIRYESQKRKYQQLVES